ncbi:hypothetical protein D3C76_1294420 [compost metagenome]
MNTRRGNRVNDRQLIVQRLPAKAGGLFLDLCADIRIGGRHIREPFDQGLVIEHRAAHQQRNFTPRGDLGHGLQGIATEIRRRISLGRVENIDQTVRKLRQQLF